MLPAAAGTDQLPEEEVLHPAVLDSGCGSNARSEPMFFHRGEGGLLWAVQQVEPALATRLGPGVLLLYLFGS